MRAGSGVPLATVRALALLALPELHDKHMPPTGGYRGDAMELVRDEDERAAKVRFEVTWQQIVSEPDAFVRDLTR